MKFETKATAASFSSLYTRMDAAGSGRVGVMTTLECEEEMIWLND
jgi:hypothetical protein